MPISGTGRLMTGGWGSPKINIKDTAFYAPLWRPDMVARGGAIVNGTGTMDVSPQALAVGANTITVTAAGTLMVHMPEGGTVASGTMTVTGSPVTVSAGIASTITTTGATGNITCTPSNIIRSKDKNNHAMTITGALWNYLGKPGRWFDQIDDVITITDVASIQNIFDGGGSLGLWINPGSDGEVDLGTITEKSSLGTKGWYIRVGEEAAGFMLFRFAQFFSTTAGEWSTSTTVLPINTWSYIFLTYNADAVANDAIIYLNGVAQTLTESSTPVGTRVSDVGANLNLGGRGDGSRTWDGYIGEFRVYKGKILTAVEAMNNYLATKWRYQ